MGDFTTAGMGDIVAGNGTYLVPDYWVPRFGKLLATEACWSQFVVGDINGADLMAAGRGDSIKCHYLGNMNVLTTNLNGTDFTGNGTVDAYETSLTVYEYGQKMILTKDAEYKIGAGLESSAVEAVLTNSIQTWEDRIGAAAIGAQYAFDAVADATLRYGTISGGTAGTNYLMPYHVRNMVAEFRRNNIPRFQGRPYEYVCMGPSGMFGAITSQTEFQNVAALQNPDLYRTGMLGVYGGVLFVEETGVHKLTYSTTTGTGVFFGPGIIGNTTVGADPNTYAIWSDSRDFPGRVKYLGWNGHYAIGLVPNAGTCARVALVHAKCE